MDISTFASISPTQSNSSPAACANLVLLFWIFHTLLTAIGWFRIDTPALVSTRAFSSTLLQRTKWTISDCNGLLQLLMWTVFTELPPAARILLTTSCLWVTSSGALSDSLTLTLLTLVGFGCRAGVFCWLHWSPFSLLCGKLSHSALSAHNVNKFPSCLVSLFPFSSRFLSVSGF